MSVRTPRLITIAAVAVLVTALAGCAKKSPTAITGLGSVSGAPTSAGAAGAPTSSSTPTSAPTTSTPKPPSYPKTTQGYAQAALYAYVNHYTARLVDLTTAGAKTNFDHIHPSNQHWHYHACGPDGAHTDCTFDNDNGDRIAITVDPAFLSKPHGVNNVVLDATEYGNSAVNAVNIFMQAWHDGNLYRMKALSNSTVTTHFLQLTPPESWTSSDAGGGAAGHTYVTITGPDPTATLAVEQEKIGQPHAIDSVVTTP